MNEMYPQFWVYCDREHRYEDRNDIPCLHYGFWASDDQWHKTEKWWLEGWELVQSNDINVEIIPRLEARLMMLRGSKQSEDELVREILALPQSDIDEDYFYRIGSVGRRFRL